MTIINLKFYSFFNPLIDKMSKKGVTTIKNLCYLCTKRDKTNTTMIIIENSSQYFLPYSVYKIESLFSFYYFYYEDLSLPF